MSSKAVKKGGKSVASSPTPTRSLAEHEPKEAEAAGIWVPIWEDEQEVQREGAAVDATTLDGCCAMVDRLMDAKTSDDLIFAVALSQGEVAEYGKYEVGEALPSRLREAKAALKAKLLAAVADEEYDTVARVAGQMKLLQEATAKAQAAAGPPMRHTGTWYTRETQCAPWWTCCNCDDGSTVYCRGTGSSHPLVLAQREARRQRDQAERDRSNREHQEAKQAEEAAQDAKFADKKGGLRLHTGHVIVDCGYHTWTCCSALATGAKYCG
jgi:hypothetical protein